MPLVKLLAGLVCITTLSKAIDVNKQIECLAKNIYYEARSSNLADQAAVADVVLNRVNSKDYPNTICKVINQGKYWHGNLIRNKCQFSWKCDGKSDKPRNKDAWEKSKILAYQMYNYDMFVGITEGATMYHANYVKPYWIKSYQLVGTIGKHKYYRKFRNH